MHLHVPPDAHVTPQEEHEQVTEKFHQMREDCSHWVGLRAVRVLTAMFGDMREQHGLGRALSQHRPDERDDCAGCREPRDWRDCPVVQVVRAGIAAAEAI